MRAHTVYRPARAKDYEPTRVQNSTRYGMRVSLESVLLEVLKYYCACSSNPRFNPYGPDNPNVTVTELHTYQDVSVAEEIHNGCVNKAQPLLLRGEETRYSCLCRRVSVLELIYGYAESRLQESAGFTSVVGSYSRAALRLSRLPAVRSGVS